MTQITPVVTPPGTRPSARPNVYTVLMLVACIALVAGIVVIAMQSQAMYGSIFELPAPPTGR